MTVLRWGLLSPARINRRLIPAIGAAARAEVLSVASRGPDRARAYAREWDIPRAHGSYEALLADPEIDVVYISLTNRLHAEWTVRAAQAGKHVLCEKPLALSLSECDRIIPAAQAAESWQTFPGCYRFKLAWRDSAPTTAEPILIPSYSSGN